MIDFPEEKSQRRFEALRKKEEEESVSHFSKKYGTPYADLSHVPIEIDAIKIVPEKEAREGMLATFQLTGAHVKIAVQNPEHQKTQHILERLTHSGYSYELFLVSSFSLEHAWSFYKKVPSEYAEGAASIRIEEQKLEQFQKEFSHLGDVRIRLEKTLSTKTSELLEVVLAGALVVDASDLHIEPQESQIRLRYRLDGVLHDVAPIPQKNYALLLSRIKLISELKLNIHDRAQDGRFTIHTRTLGDIEIRTSSLPGPYGENVVLRVLNPNAIRVQFEELGMQDPAIQIITQELKKPHGMILVTGPTGSGKTTTLYAFLKKINTPEIKIITIEDPIEYHIPGVEQTQVDSEKGYDFANGLRAIVRQDPDAVLVGEIRDVETAETAINAALTGHLVFSTLHTNNAAGAIPRLVNLGAKPSSIAPALNLIMAERLIRRLCAACRTAASLTKETKKEFAAELKNFPKNFPVPKETAWKISTHRADGCGACSGTGYRGRVGIFEIFTIDEGISRIILRDPTEYDLARAAVQQGQITMRQDGVLKVLAGITDFEEVARVAGN